MAIAADGDRSPLLRRIGAPTRVIHGEADPLVPVAAAHDLAQPRSPARRLDIVPGMGHDLPLALLPRFVEGIAQNAARTASEAEVPRFRKRRGVDKSLSSLTILALSGLFCA